MDCSKKLKNLKDSMRIQVTKLPKTESGLPDFNLKDNIITWSLFKRMLFMKDEFSGRKRISNLGCDGNRGDVNVSEMVVKYEEFSPSSEELSTDQSASSYALMMAATQDHCNQRCSAISKSPKKTKRRRPNPNQTDFEERRLAVPEKVVAADELETFALDISNDLRKITNPVKLMQAKASIRRIAEDFVLSELLPSMEASTSTNCQPSCDSQS